MQNIPDIISTFVTHADIFNQHEHNVYCSISQRQNSTEENGRTSTELAPLGFLLLNNEKYQLGFRRHYIT